MAREIFLFKNHAENKAERLVPHLFLFFKQALYEVKASGLELHLIAFQLAHNQNKLYESLDY